MDGAGRRFPLSVCDVAGIRGSGIPGERGACPGFRRREIDPAVAQDLRGEKEETAGFLLQERRAAGEDPAYRRPEPVIGTMIFGLWPGRTTMTSTWSTPSGSFTKRSRCSPAGKRTAVSGVSPSSRFPR